MGRISRLWFSFRLDPWGLVGAGLMFMLGLTPSLLPRDFFYQGVVSGIAAGIGYVTALGVHQVWLRWIHPRLGGAFERLDRLSEHTRMRLEVAETVLVVAVVIGWVLFAVRWQHAIAELTGAEAYSLWTFFLVVPVGFAVFWAMVALGRLLRRLAHAITARLPVSERDRRGLGRRLVGWTAVVLLCVFAVERVIPGTAVRVGEAVFAGRDAEPEPGVHAPEEPERSGSPDSEIAFDTLGTQGMSFVDGGLRAGELEDVSGRPAREPVRVYAGLRSAADVRERAGLLIDELERTGARDREALLLVMTTGTGWVNPHAAQAFEALYGGDTAVAAAQYSYLPSAFHFLAGGQRVQEAGREMITPVVDWWNRLPEDDRPRLYLYGESLGSSAVESAFSGMRDIANSVDGILLTGPPNFNPLWRTFVDRRDPGTREVDPEYSAGLVVRFAQDAAEVGALSDDDVEWGPTRMLYIQHPSDPVVWWSPQLLFTEPDWLKEPAGVDRLPGMTWLPVVTFLQVSADLPVSQNVPQGHGHNYGDALVAGFAAVGGIDDAARVADAERTLGAVVDATSSS